ncbi:MAG: Eco57I restriction-modification methylase domain-containing protein [Candidatus Hodarchaeales archaeon]
MQQLSQKLKDLYVSLLQGGEYLGWSDTFLFEVALNSLIKFLSLFYYQPWNKITEESFSHLRKSERCKRFLKIWFQQTKGSNDRNLLQLVARTCFYLSDLTTYEEQLLKSVPETDWDQMINFLGKYQFTLVETFQKSEGENDGITPEFLSIFAEMVITEYEKDFSVSPKVSSRKTKGVYYSPWGIIRELTNNLITENKVQVTVLDPSSGTGSFLLYAAERIFQNQSKISSKRVKDPSLIVRNYIYGVDKSGPGILVTKLRLLFWMLTKDPESEIEIDQESFSNIRNGNSLFGFINEKFSPSIELQSYFSHRAEERELEYSEIDKLTKELYKDWVNSCTQLKSVLQSKNSINGTNSETLIEKVNLELSKLLDISYIQFLSSLSTNTTIVNSSININLTQHNFFHWGLVFPEIIIHGGFDVCLGNPPYGRSVLSVIEKNILKISYGSCKGSNAKKVSLNAAGAFIERSIKLLKPDGRLAFILPFSVMRVEEFEGIRDYILEKTVINEIHDESAAFQDVTLEMCSLILTKHQKSDHSIFIKPREGLGSGSHIKKSVFVKYKRFMIYHDAYWQKIVNTGEFSQVMGDYGIDHRIVKKDLTKKYSPSNDYIVPFLHSGKCVSRYALNPRFFHWSRLNHPNKRFRKYLEDPKLICTAIGNEFRIAYKPKGIIPGTNVSIMEIINPQHDFFPLMIILNSSLINYLLKRYILNYSHLTVYLHKYYTQLVPIKYPWEYENEWKTIGRYISFLTQFSVLKNDLSYQDELTFLKRITEHLVYQLYLPEVFKESNLNLAELIKDFLLDIQIENSIEVLLSPINNIKEIIKKENSSVMKTEATINTVIKSLNTKQFLSFLHQSEKIREKSSLTQKILLDTTPKMIRT